MFAAPSWPAIGRKRNREDEDEDPQAQGFAAHRDKRHLAALPSRATNLQQSAQPQIFTNFQQVEGLQAPSTITPADSSNENSPQDVLFAESKSCVSPFSSSPTLVQSNESTPMHQALLSFSVSPSQDSSMYSDCEMTDRDSYNLSPGPYQPDRDFTTTLRERIPTPRHTNFFTSSYMQNTDSHPRGLHARQSVRLPSPISEGEASPSMLLEGLAGVSMEIESPSSPMPPVPMTQPEQTSPSPHKKGHSRSKHSLRDWGGLGSGTPGEGRKKKFSIGYRNDCQQCKDGVPGHFSHVYYA